MELEMLSGCLTVADIRLGSADPRLADLLDYVDPASPARSGLQSLLDRARLHSPLFTLRGGTNEVLRGVVARGMGLR